MPSQSNDIGATGRASPVSIEPVVSELRSPPLNATSTAKLRATPSRDSSAEMAVRRALHRLGLRYRVNHRLELNGQHVRPDVVFTRQRVAVFVDGCYWHGCPTHGTRPKHNADYWRHKFERNEARDRRDDALLRASGWIVVRAWEHEDVAVVASRVARAVRSCHA